MRRRILWPIVLTILGISLLVGAWPTPSSPRTPDERVSHIAEQIRCPTCAGLSAAESDAPLALSTRQEIARQVAEGRTDAQIKEFFVGRYGQTALVSPERRGLTGVAWMLPVLVVVVASLGVVATLRRWRRKELVNASTPSSRHKVEHVSGSRDA